MTPDTWNPGGCLLATLPGAIMFPTDDERNPYLEQEVLSASPARLRWMLIRRAEELCMAVDHLWQAGELKQADQWLLRIRDILGELLAGVSSGDEPLRKSIADLYVFMLQQLTEVEQTRNSEMLATLRDLLAFEARTWLQVVEQQAAVGMAVGVAEPCRPVPAAAATYESLSIEV